MTKMSVPQSSHKRLSPSSPSYPRVDWLQAPDRGEKMQRRKWEKTMVGEEHLTTLFKLCEESGSPWVCLLRASEQRRTPTGFSEPYKGEDADTDFLLVCKLLRARTVFLIDLSRQT